MVTAQWIGTLVRLHTWHIQGWWNQLLCDDESVTMLDSYSCQAVKTTHHSDSLFFFPTVHNTSTFCWHNISCFLYGSLLFLCYIPLSELKMYSRYIQSPPFCFIYSSHMPSPSLKTQIICIPDMLCTVILLI